MVPQNQIFKADSLRGKLISSGGEDLVVMRVICNVFLTCVLDYQLAALQFSYVPFLSRVVLDMKILSHIAFLLLLGGICCQNNRNAKSSGKSTKKTVNQGGDVAPSPPVGGVPPGAGGTAESGREGTAGARAAGQQSDDMRLQFLKNTHVTCNDGTAAG